MKRRRTLAVAIAFAAALLLGLPMWRAYASGSWITVTLFEYRVHPDLPLDKFAAGRMGIIKPTWDHSYLYVAYRYLNGSDLNASEQQAMLSLWNEWLGLVPLPAESSQWQDTSSDIRRAVGTVGTASSEWVAARGKVPGIGPLDGVGIFRSAPAEFDTFSFANCNVTSFTTAVTTLDTMITRFGIASPQVKQWVDAQDRVFDNCSDGAPEYGLNEEAWSAMVDEWRQARGKVLTMGLREGFSNRCGGMNFRTAALALDSMITKQGASSPEVKQWAESTDKALQDCSVSGDRNNLASLPPNIPAPLPGGTPLEQAQRYYQIAAATFYSGDYDGAAKLFDSIAADSSSPWRELAPYLVARAMIRKATLSAAANDKELLAQAETRLQKIIADTPNDTVKRDAQQVLGFVEVQLHPDQREQELAHAVMQSTPGEMLRQDVIDYFWILDHHTAKDIALNDDLTLWLSEIRAKIDEPVSDRAIEKWKKTSSLPWLLAAISWLEPSDPDAPALIEAARKLTTDSPAYVTVNYHLARLEIEQGKGDAARARLDALLAKHDQLPISTVNELKRMRSRVARDLTELLTYLPRTPLGITDTGDADEIPSSLLETPMATATASPEPAMASGATPKGFFETREAGRWGEGSVSGGSGGSLGLVPRGFVMPGASSIPATTPVPTPSPLDELAKEQLFDDDGAGVLPGRGPLTLLVEAAHSKTLPPNLRAQVALATFVRAILLNNEAAARGVAPLVSDSYPNLRPLIERWLAAKNANERNFDPAYMMLKNPGMSYDIETGAGGVTPIDEIDEFRDNWWWPAFSKPESRFFPEFLSAAETKSAADEWQKVSAINGPNLFCSAAIDHAKSDPDDPRSPEALYRCLTAVHLGCSNDRSTELAKSAFQLLHRRYPKSAWADRGHVWYRGDGCGGT